MSVLIIGYNQEQGDKGMTTINTTDDFIRLLRENPEFHAAARRELLTEELLELPQRFSQYAQTTDKRLDSVDRRLGSLEQGQQRLESNVTDLQQGQQRLESNVTDLQQGQRRLESDVTDLQQGQRRLENSVNALRGDALETKMPTRLCDLLSEALDVRRTQIFWMARHATPPMIRGDRFVEMLESASDRGIITEDEEARVTRTDMVIRSLRKSDGSRLWIAAEASGVIDQDDIERARQSASALKKLYGEDAVPVVYGYSISERQREQTAATPELQQVHVFLEPDQSGTDSGTD